MSLGGQGKSGHTKLSCKSRGIHVGMAKWLWFAFAIVLRGSRESVTDTSSCVKLDTFSIPCLQLSRSTSRKSNRGVKGVQSNQSQTVELVIPLFFCEGNNMRFTRLHNLKVKSRTSHSFHEVSTTFASIIYFSRSFVPCFSCTAKTDGSYAPIRKLFRTSGADLLRSCQRVQRNKIPHNSVGDRYQCVTPCMTATHHVVH